MPSASLLHWQNTRMPNLAHIDVQCAASAAALPANPNLVDENLRGYVLLLSAHFQGFCRDLYTESAQIIVSKVRVRLRRLIAEQFTANRKLDHGNPNVDNLGIDFGRFGFTPDLPAADAANPLRVSHLGRLNKWRNAAAHHGNVPPGPPLDLPSLQLWRYSCDGLATSVDRIMYTELRKILRREPWIP
jgi:hypothetical protein